MTEFLFALALKVSVLAALGCLAAGMLRRASAAVRHRLWACELAAVLLLPIAMLVLPEMRVPVPRPSPGAPSAVHADGQWAAEVDTHGGTAPAVRGALPADGHPVNWPAVPLAIWLVGTLGLAVGIGADFRQARRRTRVSIPQTVGIWKPVILLPADFDSEPMARRHAILLHEAAHVRRRDCLWLLIARMACAAYWWNPLVWLAARKLRLVAEQACDDEVLLEGSSPAEYAEALVARARGWWHPPRQPGLGAALVHRSELECRVSAILDARRRRARLGRPAGVLVAAMAVTALLPLAAASLAPAQSAPAAALHFDAASVKSIGSTNGVDIDESDDPGRVRFSGSLHDFIIRAYRLTPKQILGEPDWFHTELFAIDATNSARASDEQHMQMLQALLADRFHLQLREETRDTPIYALEVAPGGPKFRAMQPDETVPRNPPAAEGVFSHIFTDMQGLVNTLNGTYGGRLHVDRTVVDRTGLTAGT